MKKEVFALTKKYSEIEGLQEEYSVVYSANENNEGTVLCVEHNSANKAIKEKCVCKKIHLKRGEDILRLLYENSMGIHNWLDILDDLNVEYTRI